MENFYIIYIKLLDLYTYNLLNSLKMYYPSFFPQEFSPINQYYLPNINPYWFQYNTLPYSSLNYTHFENQSKKNQIEYHQLKNYDTDSSSKKSRGKFSRQFKKIEKVDRKKKNIRNIIPNLARKILSYICSEESKECLQKNFPELSEEQIADYYEFTNIQKKSLSFYIGNKDLRRIWSDPEGDKKYLQYSRVLSKNFLNNCCINSILVSKRMKAELKIEHLRYRRKILKILNSKQD